MLMDFKYQNKPKKQASDTEKDQVYIDKAH